MQQSAERQHRVATLLSLPGLSVSSTTGETQNVVLLAQDIMNLF